MRVGVLSDTHNLLRPRVQELLAGCDRLLHAGDVGGPEILERLRRIAPVEAVRGNTDTGAMAAMLPETLTGDIGDIGDSGDSGGRDGLPFGMVHRREDVPPDWPRRLRLVVCGHSHRPELSWRDDCLFLNPGACGARRFHLPLTLAILTVVREPTLRIVPEILAVE
ncbi:MAG TPA: metallophosphoesterase family protein [Thermoanaerobaculia bacterium]|jgi:putative phosphoesterase|nr:metallophosphoesterase family protein [Thermoanaerobaculia bacterium]